MHKETQKPLDLVLIDDDELVRMTWEMVAKTKGHQLRVFDNFEGFRAANIGKGVPVYVDYELGNQIKGTDVAKEMIENGFEKVYLTTGYPESAIEKPEGLFGVIKKDYPQNPGRS